MYIKDLTVLRDSIDRAVSSTRITDIHTHLFSECFGQLCIYGIDGLLTYHYVVAEAFRNTDVAYDEFIGMSMKEQAELIWRVLFVDNTPVSEPASAIITVFNRLGLDTGRKDLEYYRNYFSSIDDLDKHIDRIFEAAGLECVVMTNDPFNDYERRIWETSYRRDDRFGTALRLDFMLNVWDKAVDKLRVMGYDVNAGLSGGTISEIKRFIGEWMDRMDALYCAVSLPPDFSMTDGSIRAKIIEECVLPVCRERNLPMGLMVGVRRNVNPLMSMAGDAVGKADVKQIEYLAAKYPGNKFMVTMLSLENQHELIVAARKFRNVMLFGCWWYMNNPSIIQSLSRMRFEMLGTSFIPQHSDCRILEQLISKWEHSKGIIKQALFERYGVLVENAYPLTDEMIKRDVEKLFGGNFWSFIKVKYKESYEDRYYVTDHLY